MLAHPSHSPLFKCSPSTVVAPLLEPLLNVHTVVKILTWATETLTDLVCSQSVAVLPLLPQTWSLIFTGQYSSWSHLHLSQDICMQTQMQTCMWIVSAFVFARACQSMFTCQHEPPATIVVISALQPHPTALHPRPYPCSSGGLTIAHLRSRCHFASVHPTPSLMCKTQHLVC